MVEEEKKIIEEKKSVADIEAENLRMEAALKKKEELDQRMKLGGKSDLLPPVVKVEESAKDYAERVMGGKYVKK